MKFFLTVFIVVIVAMGIHFKKEEKQTKTGYQSAKGKKVIVTTVAGDGIGGYMNGPALYARFYFPEDVAVTTDGTIYVSDVANRRIRKIKDGQVSSFAGNDGFEIINANGASAQFKSPYRLALDAHGNIYSTDENDPRSRKITASGDVSTFAGSAAEGFADGHVNAAKFFPGNSIAIDIHGNIYVADTKNNRIRKISVSGQVSTIAGNGTAGCRNGNASKAQFNSPGAITIDTAGNLYVIDQDNYMIRKITANGNVTTVAGCGKAGYKDGYADEVKFSIDTHDIAADTQGNLYVEDGDRIRKIAPDGYVSTIAGSSPGYADGDGALARFNFPAGLGIDANDNIYVADLMNNRVRKISFE
ncbi:MAG: hypothetical protein ABI402_06045 [Ferruginibacter sp.]